MFPEWNLEERLRGHFPMRIFDHYAQLFDFDQTKNQIKCLAGFKIHHFVTV